MRRVGPEPRRRRAEIEANAKPGERAQYERTSRAAFIICCASFSAASSCCIPSPGASICLFCSHRRTVTWRGWPCPRRRVSHRDPYTPQIESPRAESRYRVLISCCGSPQPCTRAPPGQLPVVGPGGRSRWSVPVVGPGCRRPRIRSCGDRGPLRGGGPITSRSPPALRTPQVVEPSFVRPPIPPLTRPCAVPMPYERALPTFPVAPRP